MRYLIIICKFLEFLNTVKKFYDFFGHVKIHRIFTVENRRFSNILIIDWEAFENRRFPMRQTLVFDS